MVTSSKFSARAFDCVNCLRSLLWLHDVYDRYRDRGPVVDGVHTPELARGRVADNNRRAMRTRRRSNQPLRLNSAPRTLESARKTNDQAGPREVLRRVVLPGGLWTVSTKPMEI